MCDLVPRQLVVASYFAKEQAELKAKQAGLETNNASLADRLAPLNIKGTSVTRLKLYRSFYRLFPIGPTLSDQLRRLAVPGDTPLGNTT